MNIGFLVRNTLGFTLDYESAQNLLIGLDSADF